MNIDFTITALLESLKRRAMIPASQVLYSDLELATILTEELHADTVPMILSVQEDFFVCNDDASIDTSVNKYAIPPRAFGQKVKDVVLLNSNGLEVPIIRTSSATAKWRNGAWYTWQTYGRQFYFEDDKIVIHPDASNLSGLSLRQKIYRRPNNIVLASACGKITSLDTTLKTLTLANLPSSWAAASVVDIIKGEPSFKSRGDDQVITSIDTSTKTLTMTAAIPDGTAVGDWVALSGESPIAQIPYETFNILAQRGVIKIMENLGDTNGLNSAAEVYKDMKEKFITTISSRADDSPKKIVSRNPLWGFQGNGNW